MSYENVNPVVMVGDFRAARDLILERGLAKNTYTRDGKFCSIGALRFAQQGSVEIFDSKRVEAETRILVELLGTEIKPCACGIVGCELNVGGSAFGAVTEWNDATERTDEEVAELFERAAAHVEATSGLKPV